VCDDDDDDDDVGDDGVTMMRSQCNMMSSPCWRKSWTC